LKLDDVLVEIEETLKDHSIPRRIKDGLRDIKDDLAKPEPELALRATSAVYALDELSNDVNIPMHAKTMLWDIISDLEALKKE